MKIAAIDNGKQGAMLLMEDKKIVEKMMMPMINGVKSRKEYDVPSIVNILATWQPDLVILEKAQVTPVAGKNSCFGMGYCLGLMTGILTALQIPFRIVHAKTWQKEVLRDMNGCDTKQRSLMFCQRMYPKEDWYLGCKKFKDGLTDACAMAYYGFDN